MSEKPKSGEWWEEIQTKVRVFICGSDFEGDPVFVDKPGDLIAAKMDYFLRRYQPVTGCTGWDWKEPEPEPEPKTIRVKL